MKVNALLSSVVASVVALTLGGCYHNSEALPFSNKTYTAKYEQMQDGKTSGTTVSSDGQGHVSVEAPDAQFLHDYTNGKNYMIYPRQMIVQWSKLKDTNGFIYNVDWFKSFPGVQDKGENKVEGHEAHGYLMSAKDSPTFEMWFDKDTGAMVSGKCSDDERTLWTTKILQLAKQPLSPEKFRLHANFKIRKMEEQ